MTVTAARSAQGDAPLAGLVVPGSLPAVAQLVDPEVTRRKVQRELQTWDTLRDLYRARGWVLLDVFDAQVVDLLMLVKLTGPQAGPVTAAPVCLRVDYRNYDLWAPSVTFIDPVSRTPAPPPVQALQMTEIGPRNVLLEHPLTRLPFLCLPGVREYHQHPQHTGDDWLLHRSQGAGSLSVLCERIWRLMARNVVGLGLNLQVLNPPLGGQFTLMILQGDLSAAGIAPPESNPPITYEPGPAVGP